MSSTNTKTQSKSATNDNLIEQLRDLGKGVSKSVTNDLVGGITGDALSTLFNTPKSGDLRPGEAVNINENKPKPEIKYPPRYSRRNEWQPQYSQEIINKLHEQERLVGQKIEEIRFELKALVATIKNVDIEIEQAVSQQIVDPGIYHLNFLERLKTILKLLRKNLNESVSWLSVMRSRKKQRTYWALYKKKGTEFGLNPDRVVSTQVG